MTRYGNRAPMGPLSRKDVASKHYVPAPQKFCQPDRVTNAGMRAPLSLKELWANSELRPGCLDHLRFKSLGAIPTT